MSFCDKQKGVIVKACTEPEYIELIKRVIKDNFIPINSIPFDRVKISAPANEIEKELTHFFYESSLSKSLYISIADIDEFVWCKVEITNNKEKGLFKIWSSTTSRELVFFDDESMCVGAIYNEEYYYEFFKKIIARE